MSEDNDVFTEDTLVLDEVIRHINRLHPAFVLVTGDMTNHNSNQRQVEAYRKVIARIDPSVPVHHLPGNHDIGEACLKRRVARFEEQYGPSTFCFRYNGCAIIGINSCAIYAANPAKGEPSAEAAEIAEEQFSWLTKQLKESAACRARLVFGHYPVFVRSIDEKRSSNNFIPEERIRYWNLFKQYKVNAYGCGHTHYPYETSYEGVDAVTSGALASPLGKGYRGAVIWHVSETGEVTHRYIPYKEFESLQSL